MVGHRGTPQIVHPYEMTPEIEDEAEKVLAASREMPEFWKRKYEAEFVRNWDIFYKKYDAGVS